MKHYASADFWENYQQLPATIRELADQCYALLKTNPRHPSLHLKKIDTYRSVRVGIHYRALATEVQEGLLWFWIGTHSDYEKLIS